MKEIKVENLFVYERKKQNSPPDPQGCILKWIKLGINIRDENICIMGESGSGKSTLLNAISGNLHKTLACTENSIYKPPHIRFFTLFQDSDLYLSSHYSLGNYLKLAFGNEKWNAQLLEELINQLQISVAVPKKDEKKRSRGTIDYWKRLTKNNLSGGNKQKFIILLGLIFNPDVMMLDETFTDIDAESRESIIQKIFDSRNGIIMVSHDYLLVKRLLDQGRVDKVYNMADGVLYQEHWSKEYMPDWVQQMDRHYEAIEKIISEKDGLPPKKPGHRFRFEKIRQAYGKSKVIHYHPKDPLIISTSCNYAVTGENGVGKSTLLKVLMKLEPYKGNISYGDDNGGKSKELVKMKRVHYMNQNQLVFQKTGNSLQTGKPLKDFLLSYFKQAGIREQKIEELKEYCKIFNLSEDLMTRPFSRLSVGQQRRVMLIRALLILKKNGCLFIDEAMRGMDISLKHQLVEFLRQEKYQIFLISHDEQLRKALCHKELRMKKNSGKTCFEIINL